MQITKRPGYVLLALAVVSAIVVTFGWFAVVRPEVDRRALQRFAEATKNETREQIEARISHNPYIWQYVVEDPFSHSLIQYEPKRHWVTIRTREKNVALELRMADSVGRCPSVHARIAFDDNNRASTVTFGTYGCPSL